MSTATNAQITQAITTGNLGMLKKWVESKNPGLFKKGSKIGNRYTRNSYNLIDGNNNALRLAIDWDQIEVAKW